MTTHNGKTVKEPLPTINWDERLHSPTFEADVRAAWPAKIPLSFPAFVGGVLRVLREPTQRAEKLWYATGIQSALLEAAEAGLYTDTQGGEFDLVEYSGVAQMQIGYRGWITLAMRTGLFSYVNAEAVHANDKVRINTGFPPMLDHEPALIDRGEKIGYVAVAARVDLKGIYPPLYMPMAEIFADARDKSKAWKWYQQKVKRGEQVEPPIWVTNEHPMCQKTLLIRLCKPFAGMASNAVLVRDEYREQGVESGAPELQTEAEIPVITHNPPAVGMPESASVKSQEQPPVLPVNPVPVAPFDLALLRDGALKVCKEWCRREIDEGRGRDEDEVKRRLRDTMFPKDEHGKPLGNLGVMGTEDIDVLIYNIDDDYTKRNIWPSVFKEFIKKFTHEIPDPVTEAVMQKIKEENDPVPF